MQSAFQRALSDTQKPSDGLKGSLPNISSEENNLSTSLEDYEISSQGYWSTQHRCAVMTFLTLESDGHWRIVAVPLQCPEHKNHVGCGAQVNMDGLHLVSPQLIRSCKIDESQVLHGPPLDVTYSKLFTSRSFPGLNGRHQSRTKALTDKVTKSNENYGKSSFESFFTGIDSSLLVSDGSNSINLDNVFIESSKLDDSVKKNSRKKTRKKGKQNKKLSGSTEMEVSEECAHRNLTSEICSNNDAHHRGGPVSLAASQELPLLDCGVNGGNAFGFINYSEAPTTCTSSINGLLTEDPEISMIDGVECMRHVQISCYDDTYTKGVSDMQDSLVLDSVSVGSDSDVQVSCYDDIYLKGVSDMHDSFVLDSVSVSSNSKGITDACRDVKPSENESSRIIVSEPPNIIASKVYCSHGNSLNDVVEGRDNTERIKRGSQGSSSSHMQSVVSGKSSRQSKIVARSSNVYRVGSVGNSHGHTGKENNHSVWQKVQRKDADGCNKQVKKDITLKEAPLLKRNSNATQVNMPSKTRDHKQLKEKISRKSKRESSQALKQEFYSRNRSPANACAKISIQQNEILDVSSQVDQKGFSSVSRSRSQIGCPKVGLKANRVECLTSESIHSLPDCRDEVEPCGSISKTVSSTNNQNVGSLDSAFLKSSNSLGHSNLLQVRSPMDPSHLLGNEVAQIRKEISLLDNSKQNHNSGSVLQKWVPVGVKNPGMRSSSRSDSLSVEHSDELTAESWTMKNNLAEKAASDSENVFTPKNPVVQYMGHNYGNVHCSSHNHESQFQKKNQSACKIKENSNKSVTANCSSAESRDQNFCLIVTDSSKLTQAVNHACRVQLASEAIQVAIGGPIAEFERLLHFTSPVVCELPSTLSCQTCPQDQISDALLCRHETPDIPLGCLWQWYEKHGSYGLEVRAEDCKDTKRLGFDSSAFQAYFVPLLSAVQLFSNSKHPSLSDGNLVPGPNVLEEPPISKTSIESSNVGRLPIFSLLVPQPRTEDTSFLSMHSSEMPAASARGGASIQSADETCSNDLELLFEYFESEQPQQRQPLYEKIKELARGDQSSPGKMYGDPTKLNSINIRDLHPRSWYSVAWYPIYRIPDGNFRAAFLTYHSLGHLTRRSPKFDSPGTDASIVSPVVGLQSYNAQGECWFQLRHSALSQTAETPTLNPSGILKERLRTLEETASLMARAVVNKGNLTSVNRHPDYEFFLSRRRH